MIDKTFWKDAKDAWVVTVSSQIKDVKTTSRGVPDPDISKDPWKSEPERKPEPVKPKLDTERFELLLEKHTLPDSIEAFRMLRQCELPGEMDKVLEKIVERMEVLEKAISTCKDVYQADMTLFYEYYIPEVLQMTESYLEYQDIGIEEQILQETVREVMEAAEKLLLAVNETVDQIYKFATIEIKARAKALDSVMSRDGYVNPEFKIM